MLFGMDFWLWHWWLESSRRSSITKVDFRADGWQPPARSSGSWGMSVTSSPNWRTAERFFSWRETPSTPWGKRLPTLMSRNHVVNDRSCEGPFCPDSDHDGAGGFWEGKRWKTAVKVSFSEVQNLDLPSCTLCTQWHSWKTIMMRMHFLPKKRAISSTKGYLFLFPGQVPKRRFFVALRSRFVRDIRHSVEIWEQKIKWPGRSRFFEIWNIHMDVSENRGTPQIIH